MPNKVAIIGVGITPFRARYLDKTYFELAYDATKLALDDAKKMAHKLLIKIYNLLYMEFIMSYLSVNLCLIYLLIVI